MWRRDPAITGPVPVRSEDDIAALNRLFSDAFTERYRRDGLVGVRVPPLSPAVWRYAIRCAAAGALVWRDGAHLRLNEFSPHRVERVCGRHLASQPGGEQIHLVCQYLGGRHPYAGNERIQFDQSVAQALQPEVIRHQGDGLVKFLL